MVGVDAADGEEAGVTERLCPVCGRPGESFSAALRLLETTWQLVGVEQRLAQALMAQFAVGILAYPEAVAVLPATLVTVLRQVVADAGEMQPVNWEKPEWVELLATWRREWGGGGE